LKKIKAKHFCLNNHIYDWSNENESLLFKNEKDCKDFGENLSENCESIYLLNKWKYVKNLDSILSNFS
jgi:hypothetical protein